MEMNSYSSVILDWYPHLKLSLWIMPTTRFTIACEYNAGQRTSQPSLQRPTVIYVTVLVYGGGIIWKKPLGRIQLGGRLPTRRHIYLTTSLAVLLGINSKFPKSAFGSGAIRGFIWSFANEMHVSHQIFEHAVRNDIDKLCKNEQNKTSEQNVAHIGCILKLNTHELLLML